MKTDKGEIMKNNIKKCNYITQNATKPCIFDENQTKNAKNAYKKICLKSIPQKELAMLGCWAKALFFVYPSIPNIIKIVDNIVEQRASSVIGVSSIYACPESSLKQMEKVIDMGERKLRLLNILNLTQELISRLDEKSFEIVSMKYFSRMKTASICDRLALEERSIFRRINRAIEKAARVLFSMGFSSDSISKMMTGEGWIREIYQKSLSQLSVNSKRALANTKINKQQEAEL